MSVQDLNIPIDADIPDRKAASRSWYGRENIAIASFLLIALAFYSAEYWNHPNVPTKPGTGWWGWYDHGEYIRSVRALAQHNFEPNEHHYPIGYPLMGTLFYQVMPQHPFFIPDLFCFSVLCWGFMVPRCFMWVALGSAVCLI